MGTLDELRRRAVSVGEALSGKPGTAELLSARNLLEELRDSSEYEGLARVAEALSRVDPKDPKTKRLYAQSLIETGKVSTALDVLQSLLGRLAHDHPEAVE